MCVYLSPSVCISVYVCVAVGLCTNSDGDAHILVKNELIILIPYSALQTNELVMLYTIKE
jgi:hypothetical protein